MTLDSAFIIFGWVFIALALLVVFVPWFRGREDLLTTKNLFVIGSINFFGVASITTGSEGYYILPASGTDFLKFLFATVLFFLTFFVIYYRFKPPARWAAHGSTRIPDTGGFVVLPLALLGCFAGYLGISGLFFNVQFLGQVTANLAVPISTVSFGLVFWKWWTNRYNGLYFLVMLGFGLVMVVVATNTGTSRRPLLGLFSTVLIVMYWSTLRYRTPGRVLSAMLIPAISASVVISAYSVIRHQISAPSERNPIEVFASRISEMMHAIKEKRASGSIIEGETTVSCTLACIDQFENHGEPTYLHTFRFMIANPVPRAWWPSWLGSKPEALGESLPRDLRMWTRGYVNWGVGIIGHAYYDGGMWMVLVYGLILGSAFRYLDERLRIQPMNGFLVATVGAMGPNLLILSRGELGLFGIELLATAFSGWLIAKPAGFLFGTVEIERPDDWADEEAGGEFADHHPDPGPEGERPPPGGDGADGGGGPAPSPDPRPLAPLRPGPGFGS